MQANVYFFFSREKSLEFWPKYLILSLDDFDLAHLAEPPLLPGRRPKNLALGQESVAPHRPPTTRLSQACVSRRMQDQRLASRPLRVKGGARSVAPQNPSSFLLPAATSLPRSPLLLCSASSSPAVVTEWWRGRWVAAGGPRHRVAPRRRASSPPGEHAAIEWPRHGALGPQCARSPKIR